MKFHWICPLEVPSSSSGHCITHEGNGARCEIFYASTLHGTRCFNNDFNCTADMSAKREYTNSTIYKSRKELRACPQKKVIVTYINSSKNCMENVLILEIASSIARILERFGETNDDRHRAGNQNFLQACTDGNFPDQVVQTFQQDCSGYITLVSTTFGKGYLELQKTAIGTRGLVLVLVFQRRKAFSRSR